MTRKGYGGRPRPTQLSRCSAARRPSRDAKRPLRSPIWGRFTCLDRRSRHTWGHCRPSRPAVMHPCPTMSNRHLDRRALLLAGAGIATTAALVTFEPAVAGTETRKVIKGSFDATNKSDWHYLPFEVSGNVREIEVHLDYPGPEDTGLGYSKNVIDIGLFDAEGFRGWSGGARDTFVVNRSTATPGYLPGPIRRGRWRVALGP